METTDSPNETCRLAARLAREIAPGSVVLLYGELGAGKTEFVRGFVKAFDSTITVSSPTFSLVNAYPTHPPIFHLDLYRTSSIQEIEELGLDEYLAGDGIILIEWAEKCGQLNLGRAIVVRISIVSQTERTFEVKSM